MVLPSPQTRRLGTPRRPLYALRHQHAVIGGLELLLRSTRFFDAIVFEPRDLNQAEPHAAGSDDDGDFRPNGA